MEKDYSKYAYFTSRASNFAIVIKADKKKIVDGEVIFEPGLRLEFRNKMLKLEKTEENKLIIEKLREKIESEKNQDPKRRTFFEETKPTTMIPEDKVLEKLEEKNQKIAELEEKLKEKNNQVKK